MFPCHVGGMKFMVFHPYAKRIKATNHGLKFLTTGRVPNSLQDRLLGNSKPILNPFSLASRYNLSVRYHSYLSYAHSLLKKSHHSTLNGKIDVMSVRAAHTGDSRDDSQPKSVVLYVQNPFRWLVNKLDFGMLRRAWDPTFKENEFKDGAKLAVSSITQLMSTNNFEDLDGLLTSPAINHLRHEVETKWSDIQRRNVHLTKEDIKVALPQRVRFQRIDERKFCDVDMLFLALKQSRYGGTNATIFMEIKVRFHRDYTEGTPPEWTVSMFRVTRFNILPR